MEFVEIFSEMSWIAAALLFGGLVFIFVEVLLPGFGFFGIAGSVAIVAGLIVRICQGLNLLQSVVLILMVLAFFNCYYTFVCLFNVGYYQRKICKKAKECSKRLI